MTLIADSDVLIDFLKGCDPGASRVEAALRQGGLSTTAVNVFELLSGLKTKKQASAVEVLLGALTIHPLGTPEARRAAAVRLHLEAKGLPIGMGDSLIAGICLVWGGALLTRNVSHFQRVPDLVLVPLT